MRFTDDVIVLRRNPRYKQGDVTVMKTIGVNPRVYMLTEVSQTRDTWSRIPIGDTAEGYGRTWFQDAAHARMLGFELP